MIDLSAYAHLHLPFDYTDIIISVDEIATPSPLPPSTVGTGNMKIDTTTIYISQMLSACRNVVLHASALSAAAIKEDTWLNVLLPCDVIKEVIENFIKAHDFSNVLCDRSDFTE